jgi:MFS family permease
LRAVWGRTVLRSLSAIQALLAFSMGLTGTSVMIYTARDVALPPSVLGMVFALGALGAIAGAWLAPRIGRALGPGRAITLGLVTFALGAACVPMATGPGIGAVLLLAAQQIVGDGGHALHDIHDRTLRQTAVPAELLARADAGIRTVGAWASLAGTLAGGLLGDAFDARTVLWCAVAAGAAAALVAALTLGRHARAPGPAV